MKKNLLSWILAIVLTLTAAVYQRMTGPTYPLRGNGEFAGKKYSYRLPRSHDAGDMPVILNMPDSTIKTVIYYKRNKTNDVWTEIPMTFAPDGLKAFLPHQPPAGKLEYYLQLEKEGQKLTIPADNAIVARFKGEVPGAVLIPHILLMFMAMLLSNRSAFAALFNESGQQLFTLLTVISLFAGGMILGPLVQKYAFGALWTGIPFGYDLTDNKTLLAMIAWLAALWQILRSHSGRNNRWWIMLAAIILLLVYSIPHSILGSELNYNTGQIHVGQ